MYILRNIDPRLWTAFKEKSKQDGIPMRALILKLVDFYVRGKISLIAQRAAPPTYPAKSPPSP
jgi:hypothetical protein